MSEAKRERAIQLVYSLTLLAKHPNTPPHEAAAAQARIDHLRAKYKLAGPAKDKTQQVLDELRRQQAKTKAANDEWQRVYDAAKQRRAQEDAARLAAQLKRDREAWENRNAGSGDMFDDALRKDGRTTQQKNADMQANRAKGNAKWNTHSKYHATITHVEDGYSSSGNPMVTVEFLTDGQTFKGWYVKSNEYGLKALRDVLVTLLGVESVQWPLDRALTGLRGMSCTIMLDTWDKGGKTAWKVATVMPRWS